MELTDKELENTEIKKLQSEISSLKNTLSEYNDKEENLNKMIMQADTKAYTTRLLLRSIFNIVSQEYKDISECDISTIRADLEDYDTLIENL